MCTTASLYTWNFFRNLIQCHFDLLYNAPSSCTSHFSFIYALNYYHLRIKLNLKIHHLTTSYYAQSFIQTPKLCNISCSSPMIFDPCDPDRFSLSTITFEDLLCCFYFIKKLIYNLLLLAGMRGQLLTVPHVKPIWGGFLQPQTENWNLSHFGVYVTVKLQTKHTKTFNSVAVLVNIWKSIFILQHEYWWYRCICITCLLYNWKK